MYTDTFMRSFYSPERDNIYLYISIFVGKYFFTNLPSVANYNCTLHACMMHAYRLFQTCLNFTVLSRVCCKKRQYYTFTTMLTIHQADGKARYAISITRHYSHSADGSKN